MLKSFFYHNLIEAGCDEAGRGCLAGPVVAAAVILPKNYKHPVLNDSKKLSARQRAFLKDEIINSALTGRSHLSIILKLTK
jgi:ribonuclease HII